MKYLNSTVRNSNITGWEIVLELKDRDGYRVTITKDLMKSEAEAQKALKIAADKYITK
jgi:hypothetical protein